MDALFRLAGATRRDPAVEAWFERQAGGLGPVAREWFLRLRGCGDDVREVIHDGRPTACVGDAAFAYVDAFTAHVNVGFFFGAELDDPAGLLEGSGHRMRHVKVRPGADLPRSALAGLIDLAYADIRWRLGEQ
jgi:hypothetical protein